MDELEAQIREELRRILEIVCELTGLPSNWNGRLELVLNAEFRGRKPFTCDIQIDAELTRQPGRWATLIHEALHAVSAGYDRSDYQAFRGWEEGVVEQLQRLFRPTVLARLGVSIDETIWQEHEANHRFNEYISALEEIRRALNDPIAENPVRFYAGLLATPLRERPGYVLGMGYREPELPRTPFIRVFSAANAVLTRRPL
jgi:hypothetical protein